MKNQRAMTHGDIHKEHLTQETPQTDTELTGTPFNFCLYVFEHIMQITTGKGIV